MSAQSRDTRQAIRPNSLEGEVSGPNYGAAGPEPLLNGTARELPTATSTSSSYRQRNLEVPQRRAAGLDERAATAEPEMTRGVGSSGVTVEEQRDPPAQQQPQQIQEQLEAAPADAEAQQQQPTMPMPRVTTQQPRMGTSTVSELVQQGARESLSQHGAIEQVELRREMTVEHVQAAEPSAPTGAQVQRGPSRVPTWWTRVSEVLQRRVVSPMMEQVQTAGVPRLGTPEASPTSVWHSQPATPTEGGPPLMSPDLRQAMTTWTTRPSLLTPKPRRAAGEESSSGSINQEAVAEEVKRQVRLALEERESTTKKLEEENQQLRELVQFIDAGNQAEVNRGEGPLPLPRQGGNESGEGSNPAGDLRHLVSSQALGGQGGLEYVRAPHGLPVQSQVLGGQGGAEYVRAPNGLPVQSQVLGGQGGLEYVRAPDGLPVQSQVLGGHGGLEYVRAPDGLPVQSQVLGGHGGLEYVRASDGLPVQSQEPSGHVRTPPGLSEQPRSVGEGGPQKPSTSGEGVYSAQTGGNLGERDVGQVDGHKSVQEPSGVDFQAGGTSFAQNADGQNRSKVVGDEDAMVGHLHLLVQGMRQLQQLQISKKDVAEAETMKGNIELPPMPEPGDAAVEFNDWLYEAEQMLGALTDSASTLLSESLRCAREAYDHYQRASAMDRLTIVPVLTATLKDKKWYRLERRVLTLLLSAMPRSVKEDTITHRVENVTSVLYRLHVLYQPGATAERTAILGHLSGASGTEDPTEVVAKLRKWRRYLARADEMGIAAPDASILLKGLDLTLQKVLERFPEVKFRLDLARNDLRLSSAPTQEAVLKYYQHSLAELQQVAPSPKRQAEPTRLKGAATTTGAGTGGSTSTPGSPARSKGPCKFFASDNGCKRGSSCPYTHEFSSKSDRKQGCWTCGSTNHRQSECPTTGGGGKGKGKPGNAAPASSTSATTTPSSTLAKAQSVDTEQRSTTSAADNKDNNGATASTTSGPSTTTNDEASAHREEMRQLLQEANSMLSKIKLMGMKVDGVDSAREDLELFFLAAGATDERMALLDSGASHPFRQAVSELELQQAKDVSVELADGQKVDLLQTRTGTLLNDRALDQSPIVPLGSLVQQLGCTVNWSRRQGLRVNHPVHGDIAVRMRGNCPMIDELEALKLISEIEEKNLAQLREATAKGLWRQLSPTGSTWESNLDSYVATGERSQALSALMDPAFPLMMSTATDRFSFVGPTNLDLSDEAGTNYLKALPVNRKTRRRLHQTRWIVHLYDGKNQTTATYLRQLESETTTVLEIDLQRSKILNMKGWNNVIRALLWAACRGQVEGVIGGPHRDDQDELKKKLMYLWMVAEQGAKKDGLRKPFLFMELPENHSWWAAEPWRKLKDEFQLFNVKVGQGDDKGFYGATNMCFSGNKPPSNRSPSQWTEALVSEIKEAVEQWFKHPDQLRMAQLLCAMNGSLGEMSEAELKKWTKHVRNGHVPFDKRCRTCVFRAPDDPTDAYSTRPLALLAWTSQDLSVPEVWTLTASTATP